MQLITSKEIRYCMTFKNNNALLFQCFHEEHGDTSASVFNLRANTMRFYVTVLIYFKHANVQASVR